MFYNLNKNNYKNKKSIKYNRLIKLCFLIFILFSVLFIYIYLIKNDTIIIKNDDDDDGDIGINQGMEKQLNIENGIDIIINSNNNNNNNSSINKIITNKNELNKNNIIISVIIPVFNHINLLEYTLNSLKESTFKEFEVIIVDDSSTEWNSKPKINLLFNKFNNDLLITIIYLNKNMGLSFSRNIGIENSIGEWILPLDSDDLIDKSFFEKALSKINKRNKQINEQIKSNNGDDVKNKADSEEEDDDEHNDNNNVVVISNLSRFKNSDYDDKIGYINKIGNWKIPKWDRNLIKSTNLLHCTGLFKKSMWKSIGGYDVSCWFGWEDWDFWLRADRFFYHDQQQTLKDSDEITKLPKSIIQTKYNHDYYYSGLNTIVIEEELFHYRLKSNGEGLHSFCKENFKLCFSMFQTLHPNEYSVEELLISHKYIGSNGGDLIKNSILNNIKKYPNNSILYFWLGLINQYNDNNQQQQQQQPDEDHNKIKLRNIYQKSIDLEKRFDRCWQMKLQKSLVELETLYFNHAKKDLTNLFKIYSNLQLNDKVNRIYQLNL